MVNTKKKIILSVVLFSLFATITSGGFSIFYILGVVRDNTHEYLSENANSYGHELNGVIIGIESTVDAILMSTLGIIDKNRIDDENYFYELTGQLDHIVDEFDENNVNAMSVYIRFDPAISYATAGVFHADTDGDGILEHLKPTDISIYEKDDRERVTWFYEPIEAGKAIWTAPYYNANVDINMISYITPIKVEDRIIGVVGMDINFDQLENITKSREQVGSVIITDKNHNFLVHPVYDINDRIDTIDDGKLAYLIDVLEINKYGTVEYILAKDEKVLGYATLRNGWAVIVALTKQEAFTNLNRVAFILLAINLTITLIMIIFASFIARYLNTLISRNSELELMVDERTKELISTNEYLELSLAELEESQAELTILNDQLESSLIQVRKMQEKVIEPFYTTKKNKGNAGLGMHIIYNLIYKTLDGRLDFTSHEGQGVEFIISFSEIKLEES